MHRRTNTTRLLVSNYTEAHQLRSEKIKLKTNLKTN